MNALLSIVPNLKDGSSEVSKREMKIPGAHSPSGNTERIQLMLTPYFFGIGTKTGSLASETRVQFAR